MILRIDRPQTELPPPSDPDSVGAAAVQELLGGKHFIAGGAGALAQDSDNRPWTGDNVSTSRDLVEDLTHNSLLETGARNNKLKVYEMVEHPRALRSLQRTYPETGER